MVKARNNKSKQRRQPAARAPRKRLRVPRGPSSQLVAAACSQTDPFCPHAWGAKMMDENATYSMAFTSYEHRVFSCPATNNAMWELTPLMSQATRVFTINASGVQTAAGSWTPISEYGGLGDINYRVVSWGVHVVNASPAISSQGVLRFVSNSSVQDADNRYGVYAADSQVYSLKPGLEVFWVGRPQGVQARDYLSRTVTNTAGVDGPWSNLQLWMAGCAEGNVIRVEVFVHYEVTPDPRGENAYKLFATPAAPDRPDVMKVARTAAASIQSSMAGNKETVSAIIRSVVGRIAGAGLRAATSYAAGRLLGPAAAVVPQIGWHNNIMEVD